jgi:outer membrane lipoprotein-sorting protein
MKKQRLHPLLGIFALLLLSTAALAQGAPEPTPAALSAKQIIEREQQAFYYPGATMKARVIMQLVTDTGSARTRVLTMLRKNVPGSLEQKYFLYFHEPEDIRDTAFLAWKYPDRETDRWIFIPAVNMVRRIAASDSRSSFVGSDFMYEDVSGRNLEKDDYSLLREEKLDDADCYVVQSVPKMPAEYVKKLSWVDKQTFLPRKEEYYDAQNQLARVFTADEIRNLTVDEHGSKIAIPTAVKRTMKNVQSGHRTAVTFENVEYGVDLPDDIFTERALRNPPQRWIE